MPQAETGDSLPHKWSRVSVALWRTMNATTSDCGRTNSRIKWCSESETRYHLVSREGCSEQNETRGDGEWEAMAANISFCSLQKWVTCGWLGVSTEKRSQLRNFASPGKTVLSACLPSAPEVSSCKVNTKRDGSGTFDTTTTRSAKGAAKVLSALKRDRAMSEITTEPEDPAAQSLVIEAAPEREGFPAAWLTPIPGQYVIDGCIIPVAWMPEHSAETFVFTTAGPCDADGKKDFYLFNYAQPLSRNTLYRFRVAFSSVADFHRTRSADDLVRLTPRLDRAAETFKALIESIVATASTGWNFAIDIENRPRGDVRATLDPEADGAPNHASSGTGTC
ncbi:hypothetical protein C8R45DRAFT_1068699 [Mycena sanguinolenta]|nr:hypothetical protein C8R45DRAFT_1068699 [Mycena sanguinolenta]